MTLTRLLLPIYSIHLSLYSFILILGTIMLLVAILLITK